ncbi:Hsp20/alpha crystallin family protein [Natrialbaceae archaeon GCM10025810]|uniref:DUF7127 family protein n=1 Tax=Halovalidus salilacus TaxID=3075124 RepID=UPI0036209F3E
MTLEQLTREQGGLIRRYEYDDGSVLAIDLGIGPEASVDVVDDTVIVVVEDEQYDFELPDDVDVAHTFIKNGVLTVEMEGNR